MEKALNIKKLRALRWVRRFNFHQCNNYMNVAEHSYFVTVIALELANILGLNVENKAWVLRQALFHDAEEAVTGDIPFLVKRFLGKHVDELEQVAAVELGLVPVTDFYIDDIVELADALELKLYLEEERDAGNWGLIQIEQETMLRIQALAEKLNIDGDGWGWIVDLVEVVDTQALPVHLTHEGEDGDHDKEY